MQRIEYRPQFITQLLEMTIVEWSTTDGKSKRRSDPHMITSTEIRA